MANIMQTGFRWCGSLSGSAKNGPPTVRCRVADDYDGDLGGANMNLLVGMPVRQINTGNVGSADAGATIWGVIAGIEPHYDSSLGSMKYSNSLPNQTSYDDVLERESRLIVIPVAGQKFKICCDDASSATTYAAYKTLIGNNGDHIYVAGSAPNGQVLLDISNVVATAANTGGWRILDIPNPDFQDYSSNYVELIVTCNEMQIDSTTGV